MPIEITMPALSPTMTEGNLARWLKKEGDNVKSGEVIAEIETDKATMEVEAVDEGTIGKIIVASGAQNVQVNEVIALLLAEGEDKKSLDNYQIKNKANNNKKDEDKKESNQSTPSQPPSSPTSSQETTKTQFTAPPQAPVIHAIGDKPKAGSANKAIVISNSKIKASPLAKNIAAKAGLDLSRIAGTGPKGRIVREDVEEAIKYGAVKSIFRNKDEAYSVPNNNMRKVIAQRLLASKQHVPHFYLNIDCNIDKLLELRTDLNDAAPKDVGGNVSYKISVNDIIIKAVACALKEVPEANASWTDEAIIFYNNVDVSVAVAIDGGLITPIIRNADQKSLPDISSKMKELASRAKAGKLSPEEYQGGGFSISNLGMYGIKHFNAIINPPQSCILAIGAGEERVIVQNGKIITANIVSVTLSCDHRVVDGAVGANFLKSFKQFVEKPVRLVLS